MNEKNLIRIFQFLILLLLIYELVSLFIPTHALKNVYENDGGISLVYLLVFVLPSFLFIHKFWQIAWAIVIIKMILNHYIDKNFMYIMKTITISDNNLIRLISILNVVLFSISMLLMQLFYKKTNYSQRLLTHYLKKNG
jgi:hypothetical protein